VSSAPANPLLDWAPAEAAREALDHVRIARSFLVRMQEALENGRLGHEGRAYAAAAENLRLRVRRALQMGAAEPDVLAAAATAYRSDLCARCGRIYYSKTEDPRFRGMCGDCLYEE
jgi:NMD protein affecting ribosome stability and mRNA decay